jgi:RNA polymerase sigma factor (sigma-70 family)
MQRGRKNDDFPTTRFSAVEGLKSADHSEEARSLSRVARAYWKPLYKYVRLHWRKSPADAEEIIQAFFLRALDKRTFASFDATQARFRTFVRVCVDRFVVDANRHGTALKRGGTMVPFDFEKAESEINDVDFPAVQPEELFEAEWVKSLFEAAVESLRAALIGKGKEVHFRTFELFHLTDQTSRVSYAEAAEQLGISVSDVTNRLSYARREFRVIVLEALRELTGSEEELRNEARAVLGLQL